MEDSFRLGEIDLLLRALKQLRQSYEYAQFFTEELRQNALREVNALEMKVQALRSEAALEDKP